MSHHQISSPRSPHHELVNWDERCEITIHRILRSGFEVEYLEARTSVQIGAELGTGVVLVISAGSHAVEKVGHLRPGVREGLRDMAQDGLKGRMILYGLGFQFALVEG